MLPDHLAVGTESPQRVPTRGFVGRLTSASPELDCTHRSMLRGQDHPSQPSHPQGRASASSRQLNPLDGGRVCKRGGKEGWSEAYQSNWSSCLSKQLELVGALMVLTMSGKNAQNATVTECNCIHTYFFLNDLIQSHPHVLANSSEDIYLMNIYKTYGF